LIVLGLFANALYARLQSGGLEGFVSWVGFRRLLAKLRGCHLLRSFSPLPGIINGIFEQKGSVRRFAKDFEPSRRQTTWLTLFWVARQQIGHQRSAAEKRSTPSPLASKGACAYIPRPSSSASRDLSSPGNVDRSRAVFLSCHRGDDLGSLSSTTSPDGRSIEPCSRGNSTASGKTPPSRGFKVSCFIIWSNRSSPPAPHGWPAQIWRRISSA